MPAFRDLTAAEASDIAAWIVALQHQRGAGPARNRDPTDRAAHSSSSSSPPASYQLRIRSRTGVPTGTSQSETPGSARRPRGGRPAAATAASKMRPTNPSRSFGSSAPGVGTAQVHALEAHGTQMAMHPVARLTIPPHGAIDLAPGGRHIMLEEISRPLTIGDTLELQFTFEDGRRGPHER